MIFFTFWSLKSSKLTEFRAPQKGINGSLRTSSWFHVKSLNFHTVRASVDIWQFYVKSIFVFVQVLLWQYRVWKLISRKIRIPENFLNFHTVFWRKKRIKLENMPICNYTVEQGFPMTENDLDFDEGAPLIQQHLTLLPWHHSSFSQVIIPIISGNHSSMFLLR